MGDGLQQIACQRDAEALDLYAALEEATRAIPLHEQGRRRDLLQYCGL
jgi:hypothetical protein